MHQPCRGRACCSAVTRNFRLVAVARQHADSAEDSERKTTMIGAEVRVFECLPFLPASAPPASQLSSTR